MCPRDDEMPARSSGREFDELIPLPGGKSSPLSHRRVLDALQRYLLTDTGR
jgi:hypothetical protein